MGGWYWFAIIIQDTRIEVILDCLDKLCLGCRVIFPKKHIQEIFVLPYQ